MTFRIIVLSFLFCFTAEAQLAQGTRPLVLSSDDWVSEEAAMDWVIKRYIPIISIEHPTDMKRFRTKLREWNPQIKNWKKIKAFTPINVYRKTPLWDVSLGFHTYDNSEELIAESSTIDTKTFGPTLDVKATFTHSLSLFSYVNFRALKKNNLDLRDNGRQYSFPVNYSVRYGVFGQNQFSPWTWEASLEYEQLSFMSFNNKLYRVKSIILRNLQVSETQMVWGTVGFGRRFTFNKRGVYLNLLGGYSAFGSKSLDDGSLKEDVVGYKFMGSLKYYFVHRMWIMGYAQITQYEGNTGTLQQQLGTYIGYTL